MTARSIALDRPLPAELLRRNSRGLAAYSLYPVFSWPWLRKRSLLVVMGASIFGALMMIGAIATRGGGDIARSWTVPLHFTAGVLGLASIGPLLATIVRQAGWRQQLERRYVIVSIAFGVLFSFAIDEWASRAIDEGLPHRPTAAPEPPATPWLILNWAVLLAIYSLIGGGLALRRYLVELRGMAELAQESELATLRAEKHALDMRLSMLQAQIEPHFLFNTLASVRSLIESDPALAATTIELLVDYLRATIPRLRESALDSTLGQQLEICESYLRLMCVRTGRLSYRIEVEQELRTRSFPPLLLITLVENALKHGIEPKVGAGTVVVSALEAEGHLRVDVVDDGVGLRDSCGSGIGLTNVREQLHARYGEHARFTLSGAASGGACASIEIT